MTTAAHYAIQQYTGHAMAKSAMHIAASHQYLLARGDEVNFTILHFVRGKVM